MRLALPSVQDYLSCMSQNASTRTPKPALRSGSARTRGSLSKVKFGNVVVTTSKPAKSVVAANVTRSSEALERVAKKLIKPGFSIRQRHDVPHFSVDETDPKVFVRRLNGRTERGRLVNGRFEVID